MSWPLIQFMIFIMFLMCSDNIFYVLKICFNHDLCNVFDATPSCSNMFSLCSIMF
jgi:hypothetical protein